MPFGPESSRVRKTRTHFTMKNDTEDVNSSETILRESFHFLTGVYTHAVLFGKHDIADK